MMRTERFDFDEIVDQAHFYRQFSDRFTLADRTVSDLDDLWEIIMDEQLPYQWRLSL